MFIHSGSTMLNLALTGKIDCGWRLGRVSNIVGDRSTGKTLLAIEAASTLLLNPPTGITKVEVDYDEPESAFDVSYAETLGMPVDRVNFLRSKTIEDVHRNLEALINRNSGPGCANLYVLDSLDAISSNAELNLKFDNDKTYNMDKQKKLGEMFKRLATPMEESNTHLMVISQIRENITTLPFQPKWRRSGGKALDFYATHVMWLNEFAKLRLGTGKKVKDSKTGNEKEAKGLVYAIEILAKNTKNKTARAFREAKFPILFDYGIDDIYSIFNWLAKDSMVPNKFKIERAGAYYVFEGEKAYLKDWVSVFEDNIDLLVHLLDRAQRAWIEIEGNAVPTRTKSKGELFSEVKQERDRKEKEARLAELEKQKQLTENPDMVLCGRRSFKRSEVA